MKSLKKTLVLLVVFSMILSAVMPAFAATDVYGLDCEEEVARLEALKVVSGYEDGTYGPENTITRAEMAVILCKMVGISEVTAEENKVVPSKFSDVKVGDWYTGYVNVAAGKDLLSGFPDGTFRPSEQLTMNQVLTLCVNALGRGEYVAEMGAWPANYIAEATKLGLLDGVKTPEANRGNVAIIVWNTLEAPYVWDVTNTEYEGTINLGDSTRSLLSIYFRDFSYDAGVYTADKFVYADRLLKEADYVEVTAVPSTNSDLGENQLVLDATPDTTKYFASLLAEIEETRKPRGTDDEEWTLVNKNDEIVAYAPEFDNLDSYFGKVVTVIFGEDNKVVSIRVVDETIDEFLTAYEDKKAHIGTVDYKFADDARVLVNTVEITNEKYKDGVDSVEEAMAEIATILDIEDITDIEKVIKANVVLDSKGTKISRLDLFVSGNYEEIGTHEGVVLKVSKDVIYLSNGDKIDYEDLEEDELPRVIKNGAFVNVEDIVAGDTLTYYATADELADNTASTIYVSSEQVEGKVATVRKANLAVKVEDRTISPSDIEPKMTTKELKKSAGAWEPVTTSTVVKNDYVTLFLNIFGEYAGVSLEKEVDNWQFGVATFVSEQIGTEGDDEEIATRRVRILLADGSKAYHTVTVDTDEENRSESDLDYLDNAKNNLVAFTHDGNKKIDIEDFYIVTGTDQATLDAVENAFGDVLKTELDGEYVFTFVADDADSLNGKRIGSEGMRYSSSTTLYNLGTKPNAEIEVVKDWESVLADGDKTNFGSDAIIVSEHEEDIPVCIAVDLTQYATSDSMYAMVTVDAHETEDDEYVELLLENATTAEKVDLKKNLSENVLAEMYEDAFIEYTTASNKIDAATALVNVKKFNKAKDADKIGGTGYVYETAAGETQLAIALTEGTVTVHTETGCACNVEGEHDHFAKYYVACESTDNDKLLVLESGNASTGEIVITDALDADGEQVYEIYEANKYVKAVVCECGEESATAACDGEVPAKVAYKENFEIDEIFVDKDDADIKFVKIEGTADDQMEKLDTVVIERDELTIYDLREGTLKTITLSDLVDEVEADEEAIYVVPFFNSDCDNNVADANILLVF